MDGPPADEDSRVHSEAEDSDNEVMQEQAQTDVEDENEDEDGEDLLENMEGYGCSPDTFDAQCSAPIVTAAYTAHYTTRCRQSWTSLCEHQTK